MILELTAANCADYLRGRGVVATSAEVLEGGVSSTTLLVRCSGENFVLKQSLPQLRVASEWIADRRRVLREAEALRVCVDLLPPGSAPRLLWTDAENLIIAMTALSGPTWKQQLLSAEICEKTAFYAGVIAGSLAGGRVPNHCLEDRTIFRQLRTCPYYRHMAQTHPDLEAPISKLIERLETLTSGIVHGDFSPKNMVVTPHGPALIDYECAHLGDTTFDGAFCLNHLVLKSVHMPRHREAIGAAAEAYWEGLLSRHRSESYERGVLAHLGGLMLARVDGKSPAEYLRPGEAVRVRRTARNFLLDPPSSMADVFTWIRTS